MDDWEPGANGGTVNDDGSIPITDVSYRDLAPGMYDAPNGVGGYYGGNHQSNAGGGAGWGTSNGTGTESDGTGDGHGGSRWLPYYTDAAGQPLGGGGGYSTQRTHPVSQQYPDRAEDHFTNLNKDDKKYPPYHYVNSTAHSNPPPTSQSTLGGWTSSQFWAGYQKFYGRPQEPNLTYPTGQGWHPYTLRTNSSSLWHSNYRSGTGGISPCANQSLGTGFTGTGRVRRWPDDAVPGAGGVPGYTGHGSDRRDVNNPPAWSFRYDNNSGVNPMDSEGGFGGGGANSNTDGGGGGGYTGGAAARTSNGGGRGGTSRNNSATSSSISFGINTSDDGSVIITLLSVSGGGGGWWGGGGVWEVQKHDSVEVIMVVY